MSQEQLEELTGQEDSALVQTLDRLFQEAEDKGQEQGLERGRQEGRVEGRAAVLELLLERKFGADEGRSSRLSAMSTDQLDALGLALFDFDDEGALFEHVMPGAES